MLEQVSFMLVTFSFNNRLNSSRHSINIYCNLVRNWKVVCWGLYFRHCFILCHSVSIQFRSGLLDVCAKTYYYQTGFSWILPYNVMHRPVKSKILLRDKEILDILQLFTVPSINFKLPKPLANISCPFKAVLTEGFCCMSDYMFAMVSPTHIKFNSSLNMDFRPREFRLFPSITILLNFS